MQMEEQIPKQLFFFVYICVHFTRKWTFVISKSRQQEFFDVTSVLVFINFTFFSSVCYSIDFFKKIKKLIPSKSDQIDTKVNLFCFLFVLELFWLFRLGNSHNCHLVWSIYRYIYLPLFEWLLEFSCFIRSQSRLR